MKLNIIFTLFEKLYRFKQIQTDAIISDKDSDNYINSTYHQIRTSQPRGLYRVSVLCIAFK